MRSSGRYRTNTFQYGQAAFCTHWHASQILSAIAWPKFRNRLCSKSSELTEGRFEARQSVSDGSCFTASFLLRHYAFSKPRTEPIVAQAVTARGKRRTRFQTGLRHVRCATKKADHCVS